MLPRVTKVPQNEEGPIKIAWGPYPVLKGTLVAPAGLKSPVFPTPYKIVGYDPLIRGSNP